MNAEGWAAVTTAICIGIGAIVTQCLQIYLTYKRDMAKAARDEATAVKVEHVRVTAVVTAKETKALKATFQDATDDQNRVLDTIASNTNGGLLAALRLAAVSLRRVANMSRNPDDLAAAEEADRHYQAQLERQATVGAIALRRLGTLTKQSEDAAREDRKRISEK